MNHQQGQVVGGVRPTEDNNNSREMRKMAQECCLAVATSWRDIGSTFFGDQGRSSRIDHVVVSQDRSGFGLLLSNAGDSGQEAADGSTREERMRTPPCCHRD